MSLTGEGTYEGQQILSRASVDLMTTDHLTPEQKADPNARAILGEDRGWGLGVSVVTRRSGLAHTRGSFGWEGGYGTTAYSDPEEGLIGILMTQRLMDSPEPPAHYQDFWTSAYQAIAN